MEMSYAFDFAQEFPRILIITFAAKQSWHISWLDVQLFDSAEISKQENSYQNKRTQIASIHIKIL